MFENSSAVHDGYR